MLTQVSYDDKLTLEEAERRYNEICKTFDSMRSKGGIRKAFGYLPKKENKILSECVGVLLPLSMQDSVQREISEKRKIEETLHFKMQGKLTEIMMYTSNYKNTGVRVLGYVDPFDLD